MVLSCTPVKPFFLWAPEPNLTDLLLVSDIRDSFYFYTNQYLSVALFFLFLFSNYYAGINTETVSIKVKLILITLVLVKNIFFRNAWFVWFKREVLYYHLSSSQDKMIMN